MAIETIVQNLNVILICVFFAGLFFYRTVKLKQRISSFLIKDVITLITLFSGFSIIIHLVSGFNWGYLDYNSSLLIGGLAAVAYGLSAFQDDFFPEKKKPKAK